MIKLSMVLLTFISASAFAGLLPCPKVFDPTPFAGRWELEPSEECTKNAAHEIVITERIENYYNDDVFIDKQCVRKGLSIDRNDGDYIFPDGLYPLIDSYALFVCGTVGSSSHHPDIEKFSFSRGVVEQVKFRPSVGGASCILNPMAYGSGFSRKIVSNGKVLTVTARVFHRERSRTVSEEVSTCTFKKVQE
jgi:hypothetical protein